MRTLLILPFLLLVGACTPADESYCQSFGVGGAEYDKCLGYYHRQEQAFSADSAACAMQADATYPPTLYDRGRTVPIHGGAYWGRPYGYGGQYVDIQPDFQHNAEVDRLRARIIAPCMTARGWNSPDSWQSGRHAVAKQPAGKAPASIRGNSQNALPWLQ